MGFIHAGVEALDPRLRCSEDPQISREMVDCSVSTEPAFLLENIEQPCLPIQPEVLLFTPRGRNHPVNRSALNEHPHQRQRVLCNAGPRATEQVHDLDGV